MLFMMTSLQHIIILGAHNILMLMDQIFDKDDQAAKYCSFQTRHTSGGFRGVLQPPPHSMQPQGVYKRLNILIYIIHYNIATS